ncbi:Rrf2 family transcriptional regulator [Latilactobacillus fuchuensis]|jgi:Rrf2 family protein|uniref:Transcriptional regulator n=1 Tax=Latilactobacillus fuchuensis DSM 14340 = JCM 11249 TaxID=1423747 RepID=A0A0R1RPE8_9LACO|nr:Rrf2 family transcriptional regulator [Latilactobacillus fuchuensis]KRL59087.1 hypothetical protein FC69_GL001845 [Latilactobacillus fuchuensis DSM 14340 = JCM 11249]MCP8856887.1 Rrf2 family transcriptional regulator [Latilactobacillus fuchuensis]
MRLPKNFETSVFVLLILATQQDHAPLKSTRLSELLEVSDSSLKKTLRKLVVADLITSNASKDGGFTLNQAVTTITLADVLLAVEDQQLLDYQPSQLTTRLFRNPEHIEQSESLIQATLKQGEAALTDALGQLVLADLLEANAFQTGVVDWRE